MEGWDARSYGQIHAHDYDRHSDPGTTEASVAAMAELAGRGRVLELAVGTGRIALPLAARGVDVTGLEASPEMVAELRRKPGGADLPVVMGDMAEVPVEGPFDLVILVFNTLFNLTSQAAQIACFEAVAQRLAPGGRFLVEAFVPDPGRYRDHQDVRVKSLGAGELVVDAVRHDPVTQVLTHQRLHATAAGTELRPLVLRYAWPAELDLMARLAGLALEARWGDWGRGAFGADSRSHISVWRKPG